MMNGTIDWKAVVAKAIKRGDARPPEHIMDPVEVEQHIRRVTRQRHRERIKYEAAKKNQVCALA